MSAGRGSPAPGKPWTDAGAAVARRGAGPFDRRVIGVGGVVFVLLMTLSGRYGFHGDELYMLECARHLQASYVDQPVLAPLLAWVSLKLFGLSLTGLRVWPALAAGATVVAGGLTAREFGGGRRAQLLAAVGTATMPALLGGAHVANTSAYELAAWAGLALVVARIGRTGDCRWWLAGGLVAGLGVADDHSAAFFAIALVTGALLSGGRRMIFNRWFAAGAAIAVAFEVPDLWWQAQHQWATIAMTHALNHENGGLANIAAFVIGQAGPVSQSGVSGKGLIASSVIISPCDLDVAGVLLPHLAAGGSGSGPGRGPRRPRPRSRRGAARRLGPMLRAAVVSTVTLRRFRS